MNAQRLIVAALGLAALLLGAIILFGPRLKPTPMLSGYVEGEQLYLAAPISGQLTQVLVQRGDLAKAGAPLFVVDTRTLAAQRAQAGGQVAQASSAIQAAQATQAQLAAQVSAARANAAEADKEDARAARLIALGHGAISQQDADKAHATALAARAQLAAAERQAAAASAQIGAAGGQLGQAEGAREDAAARLTQAAPTAPTAARVEDVFFQVGEWAAANQPILSLLPDDRVRLRFFAPEREVARYRVGRQVRFSCDGCAKDLTAGINFVRPRPELTPPVIYSLRSRVRLVVLVEARPVHPERLTPGLPVDVIPLGPDAAP